MLTRRELLIGGAAAIAVAMLGRPARSVAAPTTSAAVPPSPLDAIVGESPAITAFRDSLRALLDRAAGQPRPPVVLLLGETGTGKNLAAEVMHRAGPRGRGAYVSEHFVAIPETFLAAHLYGYAPVASTTRREVPGAWEAADGGTLHLEEISVVDGPRWRKIVRTIETGTVRHEGSRRSVKSDAWIIMSTGVSLDSSPSKRTLRRRMARLDPVILTVPPLRKRGDDVQLLADHFLARACRNYDLPEKVLTHSARRALGRHSWPGNVRELVNEMECAAVLTGGREIGAADLRV